MCVCACLFSTGSVSPENPDQHNTSAREVDFWLDKYAYFVPCNLFWDCHVSQFWPMIQEIFPRDLGTQSSFFFQWDVGEKRFFRLTWSEKQHIALIIASTYLGPKKGKVADSSGQNYNAERKVNQATRLRLKFDLSLNFWVTEAHKLPLLLKPVWVVFSFTCNGKHHYYCYHAPHVFLSLNHTSLISSAVLHTKKFLSMLVALFWMYSS